MKENKLPRVSYSLDDKLCSNVSFLELALEERNGAFGIIHG
jgi:hypothetical protein